VALAFARCPPHDDDAERLDNPNRKEALLAVILAIVLALEVWRIEKNLACDLKIESAGS
jgi:hypothetical protein